MTNSTVSAAGGAMPKIDRAGLMRRAWAIFFQTYKYPQIKFGDIGRPVLKAAIENVRVNFWAEIDAGMSRRRRKAPLGEEGNHQA